jgi:hypothetical protein
MVHFTCSIAMLVYQRVPAKCSLSGKYWWFPSNWADPPFSDKPKRYVKVRELGKKGYWRRANWARQVTTFGLPVGWTLRFHHGFVGAGMRWCPYNFPSSDVLWQTSQGENKIVLLLFLWYFLHVLRCWYLWSPICRGKIVLGMSLGWIYDGCTFLDESNSSIYPYDPRNYWIIILANICNYGIPLE